MAHTQVYPPGADPNAPINCTTLCVEWPKTPGNLSITVDVYLNTNLDSEEVSIINAMVNAMPKWNEVAARNPHLQRTHVVADAEAYAKTRNFGAGLEGVYAGTTLTYGPAPGFKISYALIEFNTLINWNGSYDFHHVGTTEYWADARKVATHELGHAEGLGHVSLSETYSAIMKQGAATSWWPHADDDDGIVAIYDAYP